MPFTVESKGPCFVMQVNLHDAQGKERCIPSVHPRQILAAVYTDSEDTGHAILHLKESRGVECDAWDTVISKLARMIFMALIEKP